MPGKRFSLRGSENVIELFISQSFQGRVMFWGHRNSIGIAESISDGKMVVIESAGEELIRDSFVLYRTL